MVKFVSRFSARGALAFWITLSVVCWFAVAGLVMGLSTGDQRQIATDTEAESLNEIAPAAGPDRKAGGSDAR